ncbi:PilN domain-containing protein [Niveibacterium sp. 24ML]|uniref:PilN domain-containing protein n=1 Tax=Niveibacterium sp. 24ML TaxID=2985512 RepID=UPI00227185D3|nr:PilN domain-containing protein [Niveibacterium sp. 24ML]MCX9155081.1 PilN domain-containing protein [Niveibacterium sp. 24ML]
MKPNINLADHSLLPREPQFTLNSLALALLLVALCMSAIAAGALHVARQRTAERAVLQAQFDRMQRDVAQLTAELAPRKNETANAQRLAALTQEGEELRRISRMLDGGIAGSSKGFSESLDGLAAQRVEGVWLTAFTLAPARAEFVGHAVDAARLPLFIAALGRIDALREHSFASIELKEAPAPAIEQSAPGGARKPVPLSFRIGPGEEGKR